MSSSGRESGGSDTTKSSPRMWIEARGPDYRTAVILSDLEGFSYQEIAEMTDVPVGTVKSRLFRGRRVLQGALYDYAVSMGYIKGTSDEA
jgi:RNA polymerase sigma-70 factor (ECF subfamily)